MISKAQIKFINSLKQKKFRDEHGFFIAEGNKIIQDFISSGVEVNQIFSSVNFQHSIFSNQIEVVRIKESELKKISSLVTPNQMLALCKVPNHIIDYKEIAAKLTLVLDDIKDPGNMGTIIRIADWFGIENIVCSNETVDCFNPKVIQATMGSIARVKIFYVDLISFFETMNQYQVNVYGAFLDGDNIYQKKLSENGLLVIGNESAGISDKLNSHINEKIKIPSFSHLKSDKGEAESLNAAIATAVICSEFRRGVKQFA